ncbi:MAG: hypothetical protein AAB955_03195 [Patescibacteria group bacterium]
MERGITYSYFPGRKGIQMDEGRLISAAHAAAAKGDTKKLLNILKWLPASTAVAILTGLIMLGASHS